MKSLFEARFPSTKRAAAVARRALIGRIGVLGFSRSDLADIETAVGEALANAAEHGHRPGSGFDLRVYVDDGHVVIEVRDEGAGFSGSLEAIGALPPSDAPRGFGIYLMRSLMDVIEYEERGTYVRLKKRLPVAGTRAAGEAATG
jgi:anti-sigma regulatory factor (Ser/Thr protein kinase)